nr:unnamed protein product [Spirometra erinaceieuropaei]
MIRALLQDCHLRLRKYKGVLSQAIAKCTDLIGEDGTMLLKQAIDKRARELRAQRDIELADELRNISRTFQEENDVLVHNLSSKELTPGQLKVLSHEACFNTTDADPVNLVATVESILKQTEESDETKHLVRQQVTALVMAHKPRANITRTEQDALKKLRADTSIVVLPADKGRSTVVLDKTDYIQKANTLLDDRQAYLRCDDEPMRKLLTQLDKTLAEMQTNKVISKSVRLAVKPTDSAAPRFYGLPKVHKVDVPLRPIVSLRGASTFNLAKWLFRHLRPLTSGATTTDLAMETVSELLERQYDETDKSVKRRHLVQILKFCLKKYFTFEGTMYEQIKGTPMGSSLSGFIAEAVLQKLESLVFTTHRPTFWTRYVDDTFVIIKREMIEEFHIVLISVFPDIQFTMEAENNNQLPFVDVLVHRKPNGNIKTTVYRKATNTRQILSYHSKHPLCHKRSCVQTLYSRAETHCSEPDDRRTELRYLQRLFIANGYPRNFIERSRLNKKRRLRRKFLSDRSSVSINAYKAQGNLVMRLLLGTRRIFQKDLLNLAAENPNLFYGYIRRSKRNRDPIPLLKTIDDLELIEYGEKAEHLSQFYKFIFTKESTFLPSDCDIVDGPTIVHVSFAEAIVRKVLLSLKESKSPGPDNIPPKLLKELAGEVSKPLSMLFQASFEAGYLPADWKSARITLTTITNFRGHPLKLRVTGAKLDIREFFFSNRVIEVWNALPTNVIMSTSVEAFKRKLDQFTTKRHNAT